MIISGKYKLNEKILYDVDYNINVKFTSNEREFTSIHIIKKTQTISFENAQQNLNVYNSNGWVNGYDVLDFGFQSQEIDANILNWFIANTSNDSGSLVVLYQNSSENERVDKTNYLTPIAVNKFYFKSNFDIINPIMQIAFNQLINFNYLWIPNLNRYYFVKNFIIQEKLIYVIECEVDVLMSFKNEIKGNVALVERQENVFNDNIIDNEITFNEESDFTYIEIPTFNSNMDNTTDMNKMFNIVMQVSRGKN